MVWLANPERYGQMQYRYCGKKWFTPARVIARFMAQFRSR